MKRRVCLALPLCTVIAAEAKPSRSSPKAFEVQVLSAIQMLNQWNVVTQKQDGRWQKRRLDVTTPKYDVVRSESALRPLTGTLRMYVHTIGHAVHNDRDSADQELALADGGPLGVDGKDWVTTEYDLQFEPSERGWMFFQGKCLNSMTIQLSRAQGTSPQWYELTRTELEKKTMHAVVLRAFEPSQYAPASPSRPGRPTPTV